MLCIFSTPISLTFKHTLSCTPMRVINLKSMSAAAKALHMQSFQERLFMWLKKLWLTLAQVLPFRLKDNFNRFLHDPGAHRDAPGADQGPQEGLCEGQKCAHNRIAWLWVDIQMRNSIYSVHQKASSYHAVRDNQ